jgi:hypothetical protein
MRTFLHLAITLLVVTLGLELAGRFYLGGDEQPNEAYTALNQFPPHSIQDPHKNGYLVLLGFANGSGKDPAQVGYEMWLEAKSAGQLWFNYDKEGRLSFQIDPATVQATVWTDLPFPKRSLLGGKDNALSTLVLRYAHWLAMPFDDWGYAFAGTPRLNDLVAVHRVYVAEGFTSGIESGVDRLVGDLKGWRKVLAFAHTPAIKIMAAVVVDEDTALLARILGSHALPPAQLERMSHASIPLTKDERSWQWPIRHQVALWLSQGHDPSTSETLAASRNDSFHHHEWVAQQAGLAGNAFVSITPPEPAGTWLTQLKDKQRTLNFYGAYYQQLIRAAEISNGSLPKIQDLLKTRPQGSLDRWLKPLPKIEEDRPQTAWKALTTRVTETDVRLRLLALQLKLRQGGETTPIVDRIVAAGPDLYDPFTGIPMLWSQSRRTIYSVGKDGIDDGGDPNFDLTVPLFEPGGGTTGNGLKRVKPAVAKEG